LSINHFKLYCQIVLSSNVIKRALKVSLVVGSILNIINQGEVLSTLDTDKINFIKFVLTYFVPYAVTTYTATSLKLEFHIGTKAIVEADLKCNVCHKKIHVQENEIVPECPKCGVKTHWKLV